MSKPLPAAALAAARLVMVMPLCWSAASAQQTNTTEEKKESSEPAKLEKFEVTGSLIKRTDFEGPSPVRMITREDIELTGLDNLSDIMREIPEVTNLGINEGGTTSFVRGANAINLRNLGSNNTLILVDGRRQAPNGIADSLANGGTVFVDLNRIPVSLIERVELLKDGASAVYGSDATAGVINIITRKNFVGGEVTARYGNYFNTDGGELSLSFFGGVRTGKARVHVNYSYASRHANAAVDQPFSANADQTERWRAYDAVKYASLLRPTATATSSFDGRSATGPFATVGLPTTAQLTDPKNGFTAAALINPLTGTTATALPGTGGVAAGTLGTSANFASVPRESNPGRPTAAQYVARAYPPGDFGNSYNFQTFVWNVPERITRNLSAGFGYNLTPSIEFDAGISYSRIRSETHFAPSPISTTGDNNILVPASNYYNPFGVPVAFTYRPIEVGPRIAKIDSKSLGYQGALRGSFLGRFDWDLGAAYTKNESNDRTTNAISESKVRAALAKNTPDALNIFGGPNFKNDPNTISGIKVISGQAGEADTLLFTGRVSTTEIFSLPWGKVGSSLGVEHREEHFNVTNDDLSTKLDDIIGQVRLADPTKASRHVDSAAAELRVPLVKENHFRYVHTLELSGATRYEKFSDGYNSGYKPFVGVRFRPFRSLLLRGSYSETYRSPTLPQLYGGVVEGLVSSLPDLRRPQALTGDPVDASTYQRLVRTSGNPLLKPETGITKQISMVYDVPLKRLNGLSLDFSHGIIEQKNRITSGLGTTFIRQNELTSTGDLVIRDPQSETYTNTTANPINVLAGAGGATRPVQPGETVTVPGRIRYITDSAVNLAQQLVRYYDYGVRYRLRTAEAGDYTFSSTWTYYGFYASRRFQTDPIVSSVGRSLPRYRGQTTLAWSRRSWFASLGQNYIHRYRDLTRDQYEVQRYYTFSSSLGYGFPKTTRFVGDLRITVGLENMFGREPPLDNSTVGYNQGFVGRPGGRFGYLSVRKSL